MEGSSKERVSFEIIVSGLQEGTFWHRYRQRKRKLKKIMGRVLNRLKVEKIDLDLHYIEGGSKPNAIPRYTRVKVTIPKGESEKSKSPTI